MRVMVALSGGVDSSLAAALLDQAGHEVVGVTMKLWGGESDRGCCSMADVDDARRAAQQLDVDHHVFNFGDDFLADVVDPYVAAHRAGGTPNPCIECNRHLKFGRLLRRAETLGFDAVATGHHARIVRRPDGSWRVARGADRAKDQSYVLYMLGQRELARVLLPIGDFTKDVVRRRAADLGLRTATKADSQDVCFITSTGGREAFLGRRIPFRAGRVVDQAGNQIGAVPSVELVTLGQRRGLGLPGGGPARYAVDVDRERATITVGDADDLLTDRIEVESVVWADRPVEGRVDGQVSAHGQPRPGRLQPAGDRTTVLWWDEPQPAVAAGQSVVFYRGDEVEGGGLAVGRARSAHR